MINWIDRTPLVVFIFLALSLGLAPFVPEPHIIEKLRMLFTGALSKPIDVFDLFLHGTPWALLGTKLVRLTAMKKSQ